MRFDGPDGRQQFPPEQTEVGVTRRASRDQEASSRAIGSSPVIVAKVTLIVFPSVSVGRGHAVDADHEVEAILPG